MRYSSDLFKNLATKNFKKLPAFLINYNQLENSKQSINYKEVIKEQLKLGSVTKGEFFIH